MIIVSRLPVQGLLEEYYAMVGPLMERSFGHIPFAWARASNDPAAPVTFHGPLAPYAHPKGGVVEVTTATGTWRYPRLSAANIEQMTAHGPIELHSWSPSRENPERAAYARLLVEESPTVTRPGDILRDALSALQAMLFKMGLNSIPVVSGPQSAAIWIPFTDSPAYDRLRLWLHRFCANAVENHPKLFTLEPNTHGGSRAHLHVETNAPGRYSILPYSLRLHEGYPLALPVPWSKLADFEFGSVGIGDLDAWLKEHDEVFSLERASIEQRFDDLAPVVSELPRDGISPELREELLAQKTRGPIISVAVAFLQDGHAHTADEILAYALSKKLLTKDVTRKYVYTSLIEYIARTQGNGHKPAIVQTVDRSFRINEPPDNWPVLEKRPQPAISAQRQALIDRLETTVHGKDPTAFEQAVCDALDALGFAAKHLGGNDAPDGYADALLGPLGYRVMIECKTGGATIPHPDAFEAAKYREPYGAQYCMLIGPGFGGEVEIKKELLNHRVSGWTVSDLQTLLKTQTDALQTLPLFAPGFAADALDDILWEHDHGQTKRVRIIAEALARAGWAAQSAYHGTPTEAPKITEDVAMLLVNQELAEFNVTCTREDTRAAISYLSNPLINQLHLNPDGSTIILRAASPDR